MFRTLVVQLRWDGQQGVAAHGSVSKVLTRSLVIAGHEFEEIDFQVRADERNGADHVYAWVKEPGATMGRQADADECDEIVRRLQDMSASASNALFRKHTLPRRIGDWLAGIRQAVMRFPTSD
jgi:hypothetical protein